jgi:hypothetical protein
MKVQATKPQDKLVTESQWVIALKEMELLSTRDFRYEYCFTEIDLEDYMTAHRRSRLGYNRNSPTKIDFINRNVIED